MRLRKPNKFQLGIYVILAIGVLLNSGCSDSKKMPSKASPAAQKVRTQQTQTQQLQTQQTQTQQIVSGLTATGTVLAVAYTYNSAGRLDPFAPIVEKEDKKAKIGDRPPLERYNVTEYKLSGIVWGGFGYNAMMEGPDGKGYFVRVGTIIGQNRGIVRKITQTSLVIEEKFKTITGETEAKQIIVELRNKQEAMP